MVTKKSFGSTSKNELASLYTISNASGAEVDVTDFGATLVAIRVPAADGSVKDVLIGLNNAAEYEEGGFYLGATIGRNGNRIGGAAFTLEGKDYTLTANEGANSLHSAPNGYDCRMWEAEWTDNGSSITFSLNSPDGDQGFPGNFKCSVTVSLSDDNAITLSYNGLCDRTTIANMTNHSYFNLSGNASEKILGHLLTIHADGMTVVDSTSIPTGEVADVTGTPFDFRTAKAIEKDLDLSVEQLAFPGGFDHNFALNDYDGNVRKIAEVVCESTGIVMEVFSDLPGVQFYAGNFLTDTVGKGGVTFTKHCGLCLETQYFPDAIHHENFASPVLKAGTPYRTETTYKFSCR